jgi:hypothetical protein
MKTLLLANADKIVAFLIVAGFFALVGFALWSNAKAHGDGRGEA